MFGLLETEIGLYKITGDEKYRNRVEKAALYFMDHVYLDKEKDLYIWRYWEWEGYTKNESHTYAKLDAEFIARCYNAGIVFTEKDMSRFANTWATNFIKPNGKLADLVDGKGERNHEYYISYANDLSLWEPRSNKFYSLSPGTVFTVYINGGEKKIDTLLPQKDYSKLYNKVAFYVFCKEDAISSVRENFIQLINEPFPTEEEIKDIGTQLKWEM
jgi:hypothetical protein